MNQRYFRAVMDARRRAVDDPADPRRPGHAARDLRPPRRAADPGRRGHGPGDVRRGDDARCAACSTRRATRPSCSSPAGRSPTACRCSASAAARRSSTSRRAEASIRTSPPRSRAPTPHDFYPTKGFARTHLGAPRSTSPPALALRDAFGGGDGAGEQHAPPVGEAARRGARGLRGRARTAWWRRSRGRRPDAFLVGVQWHPEVFERQRAGRAEPVRRVHRRSGCLTDGRRVVITARSVTRGR